MLQRNHQNKALQNPANKQNVVQTVVGCTGFFMLLIQKRFCGSELPRGALQLKGKIHIADDLPAIFVRVCGFGFRRRERFSS